MVSHHDSEMDNDIVFITNNFEISSLEVATTLGVTSCMGVNQYV